MTGYIVGIIVAMIIFVAVGVIAGNSVKDTNDYYVAGRRSPVILIVGSLIASFLSTGAFMGDTGEVYGGFFMGIVVVGILQASGYVYGANLFGKYIRRAKVNTIPEYFGSRFSSRRLRILASTTLLFAVTAYMLSAMQGVSTLMSTITGLEYKTCVIIAWLSFTIFTVYAGSKGVLITDTIMFLIFLVAALIGIPFIINAAGGWNDAITALANSTTQPDIIAWTNNLEYMYPSGAMNLVWAIVYGIVWAVVVMVSPWQTSRYLMAKDEHTVMRSSVWASMGVVTVTMALYFSAAFIYKVNPDIEEGSTALIWAAMNLMPMLVGIVLLTGILSAGISSASTFLSLIGSSLTNDILEMKAGADPKKQLLFSRVGMGAASLLVLAIAFFNPPQIFWIMYFGGTVIASAWGVVAISSVWSEKMSENGAFLGMLLGFLGCVITKSYSALCSVTLPIYLDPFFVGVVMSIVGMLIGNKITPASEDAKQKYRAMHVRPESEKDPAEEKKTHNLMYIYLVFGVLLGLFFVLGYALPYMRAVG
ncbi:MAG: sodium:solute symporter family protein [Lachnospiraceae bacterium]|nr:sodium:solute symporter family protein [Lachnospiraceae bacterium]